MNRVEEWMKEWRWLQHLQFAGCGLIGGESVSDRSLCI